MSTIAGPPRRSSGGQRRAQLARRRHPGDPLDPLGPPARRPTRRTSSTAGRPGGDVRLVDQRPRATTQVQQPERERRGRCRAPAAGAGAGALGGAASRARVDDDERRRRSRGPVEVPHGRRHRLGEVAADQHEHVGAADVGERERQPAVDAERAVGRRPRPTTCRTGRCSRCCAVPQRDPGELAERVGLLVGQPAAAEDGDRVRPVLGRAARGAGRRPGRAPRPSWPARSSPVAAVADQRRGEPLAVAAAAPAAVQPLRHRPPRLVGKLAAQAWTSEPARRARQRHAALQRAVGAVGGRGGAVRPDGAHRCQTVAVARPVRPATGARRRR